MTLAKLGLSAWVLVMLMFVSAAVGAPSPKPGYEFFDLGYDTYPLSINSSGDVVGYYGRYGRGVFLRKQSGELVTFAVPGFPEAAATSINNNGVIAGEANGYYGPSVGFIRWTDGSIETFSAPVGDNAGFWMRINDSNVIVGTYYTSDGYYHGFIRAADGTITTVEPLGSKLTHLWDINNNGVAVGDYGTDRTHGFLRSSDGTITTIDVPGARITSAKAVNDGGWIAGEYYVGRDSHGFMRDPTGAITTFFTQ